MADHRLNKFLSHNSQSFTLIEILITVAIIAVLMTVVVLAINPTEITKKARDTQRLTDMANLEMLLQLARSEGMLNTSYCDGTKIYASLPSNMALSNSNLPSGVSWVQVSEDNLRKSNGTGWIPLNLNDSTTGIMMPTLPVDPKNTLSDGLYYTFYCNSQRQYILTSYMESKTFGPKGDKDSKTIADGGPDPYLYELGNNLFISPLKPVGSWSFEEGNGTTAYDSSGNNNHGTLSGGPTWTTGKVNGSLSFDGVDDYVGISDSPDFIINQQGFTYEAWIKPTSFSQTYNMFIGHYLPYFDVNSNRNLHMSMSAAGAQRSVWGATSLNANVWYHVAATYDNQGYMKVYLNGVKDGQAGPYLTPSNSSSLLYIGKWYSGSSYLFTGLIDEVRVYNRSLSPEEIKRHYEESK